MANKDVKKRLMYLSGEDFYFYCYSALITLDYLKCKEGKYFKDYRKLAFIIEFIKDKKLGYIISGKKGKSLNPIDKEYLFGSYSAGLSRRSEVLKLLFTLEKKNYIFLQKGGSQSEIDVSLNERSIPNNFFNKKLFAQEYNNIRIFCNNVSRLSVLRLDTMLNRVYEQNGIMTWDL
jgi:hypothetical protein